MRRLHLSAHPEAARVHLQLGRLSRHGGPSGPFFQRLSNELPGAEIVRLEQVGGDRMVLVELRGAPCGERRALLLELTGRHANLLLLGPDDRLVDWLVPAPSGRGAPRLALGTIWKPPGGSARAPAGDPGPSIAEALPLPPDAPPGTDGERAPLSWRVEQTLGARADEARTSELSAKLRARLARRIDRTRALVRGLEERARASAEVERVRQDGELLKTNLARLRRGMDHAELFDWFATDGSQRRITLDPERSPQENMERLFDRARKLERSRETVASEIEIARVRLAALEDLRARLESAAMEPEELEAEAVERGLLEAAQQADPRRRAETAPRLPYRVFQASRGSEIRVGRSAADNDQLTLRHSRGSDLWLHTADAPGSHVVLRLAKGATADEEEVLDAAHLAVHFSPLRGTRRALVHLAPRKLVHKPRGAKPGLVGLSGGKTIDLRVQQERIDRLLRTARRGLEGAQE